MRQLPPVQPSVYDPLFKEIITAGWAVKSDGHVESPQGYFAIVEIPTHADGYNEMQQAIESDHTTFEWPEPGWFFTVENSDGLIFVYRVDKRSADLFYAEYLLAYAEWEGE